MISSQGIKSSVLQRTTLPSRLELAAVLWFPEEVEEFPCVLSESVCNRDASWWCSASIYRIVSSIISTLVMSFRSCNAGTSFRSFRYSVLTSFLLTLASVCCWSISLDEESDFLFKCLGFSLSTSRVGFLELPLFVDWKENWCYQIMLHSAPNTDDVLKMIMPKQLVW